MIRIRDLKKSFGKLQVLRGISLEMHAGQVVALIGPNASGKTTLLKCILRMVVPDSGVIEFGGKPVNKEVSYRKHIGYMPQIGRYPENMRVRQVVNMMTDLYPNGADMDTELAEAFYLQEMDQKFMRTLSGGSRQKVSAVLAFLFDVPVLILDEPTAGLDPVSAEVLRQKILREREKGKLIIISSHVLSELEGIATDILYIADGQVKTYQPIAELLKETGTNHTREAIIEIMNRHAGNH